jgi:hypothetical protein
MSRTAKAWINAVLLAITLALNTLGAIGLINGLTQKQISDMYLTLITPGPATFSIWSVIYALLLISVIVMIVKKNDPYYQKAVDEISVLFWVSCLLNIAWIVSFSFVLVELSVVFILGFVITLALINRKLLQIQQGKRWLLPLSFALYNGWLTIATVVNIAAALVKLRWNGFGIPAETWAVIILIVAVLLVYVILMKIRNAAYPLPVAWAYLGIYQFLVAQEGTKGQYGLLQAVALAGMAVLIILAAIQLYRNRFAVLPEMSQNDQKKTGK